MDGPWQEGFCIRVGQGCLSSLPGTTFEKGTPHLGGSLSRARFLICGVLSPSLLASCCIEVSNTTSFYESGLGTQGHLRGKAMVLSSSGCTLYRLTCWTDI